MCHENFWDFWQLLSMASSKNLSQQIGRFLILAIKSLVWSYTEAATGDVLQEKVFLEIAQKSQENASARVSILIKLDLQLY